MTQLTTFFRVNGFKKQKELELERHYLPMRYRKRPEYIPLASEVNKMIIAGRNPSEKATIFLLYESGLRNSTARAVRYSDVKAELDLGLEVVHVPVRSEMKEVDPDAAKGRVEYDPFIGREAVRALKEQIRYVEAKIGRPFPPFGMRVQYERLAPGVYGATDHTNKTIVLATEDWDTFFHELGHAIHRSFEPKSGH